MRDLRQHLKAVFSRHDLVSGSGRIVLAVSGGIDSMVLLDLCSRVFRDHPDKMVIAHINHSLRGEESDGDEGLVRKLAAQLKLPFESRTVDVRARMKSANCSMEMAARELRHQALAEIARNVGAKWIATAHHADDQAELVLLRLLRGTGLDGLGGMGEIDVAPYDPALQIIRPLLGVTRSEIVAWAARRELAFREDTSNASTDPLRNRVRHQLLPLLEKEYQPQVATSLLRVSEIARASGELIRAEAETWLRKPRKAFARLPVALQREVILLQLHTLGVVANFDLIEALRLLPGKQINPDKAFWLVRQPDGTVTQRKVPKVWSEGDTATVKLTGEQGELAWMEQTFEWRLLTATAKLKRDFLPGWDCLDAAKVGKELRLRRFLPGDRMQPFGASKPIKLKSLFSAAHIPSAERRDKLVVETAKAIVWVEGLRIAEPCKVTPGTRQMLIFRLKNPPKPLHTA